MPNYDEPGEVPVAVITDSYWQRNFGRYPDAVGRTIRVSGVSVTIVGITHTVSTAPMSVQWWALSCGVFADWTALHPSWSEDLSVRERRLLQSTAGAQTTRGILHGISSDLGHPGFAGMPGDAAQGHAAAFQVKEEKHVIGSQPSPGQYFNGEEIGAGEDRHMRRDEFFPGRRLAALGGWCDPVALQHVADGLSGNLMTEIGQCAGDPIITPAGVFTCHPYNECFHIGRNTWAPGIRTLLRAIELLRNQPPVPGQNGGRFGRAGNLGQILTAEAFADFGQRRSLLIRKAEPSGKLRT
jgi:hypothetical protein